MASDSFTGANGTALETHDANWTGVDAAYPVTNLEINSNIVEHEGAWDKSGAYYDGSSEEISQIVFKGGSTVALRKVAVRMDTDHRGYSASLGNVSGANFTRLYIHKDGVFLTQIIVEYATADDHTIKIETAGTTTVTIDIWIDGNAQSQQSDSSSPISGPRHPGFHCDEAGVVSDSRFDDWTDGAAGGISIPVVMHHLTKNIASGK